MPLSSLTFALDADHHLVYIDEVPNGLACLCTCPGCGERLIAKHGSETAHHFAHEGGSECASALESALHLAAKTVLLRERRIVVPALEVEAEARDASGLQHIARCRLPSATITLDAVSEEVWLDGFRPDIVAKTGTKTLLVEVAVTHFADKNKLDHLVSKGLPALEIDLSEIERMADWPSITAAVIEKIDNKKWLFNPKTDALRLRAEMDARKLASMADQNAENQRKNTDFTHEYERTHTPGYQEELQRFLEFIAPENQAALRDRIAPDGENEDAWQSAVQYLGADWNDPPPFINVAVPGELAFVVDRRVWQAGIFFTFIRRNPKKSFATADVVRWTHKCFERRESFSVLIKNRHLLSADAAKMLSLVANPVSNYLRALETMGFIEPKKQRYLTDKSGWRILRWG